MSHKLFLSIVLLLCHAACGGGTSGSGIKTYEGRVYTTAGDNITDARVLIEDTGDSAYTDDQGIFRLQSEVSESEVTFLIETDQLTVRFPVKNTSDDYSSVQLDVRIDLQTSKVHARELELDAWFAGLCDYYFENREIIRQANAVPAGTICSLNVRLRGDGRLLADTPVAVQYAGCEEKALWHTKAISRTGTDRHTGYAEINFEFIDSPEYCRYRVIAPYGPSSMKPVVYPIDTFTEQKFYASSP